MHTAMMLSLQDELEKIASHAAELAGLGMLAAPSISHLRGKDWSEKNKARMEVAGLGVLAAPSALAVGKAGLSKLKGLASKLPKHASLDAWNPESGALISESGGSRALSQGTTGAKAAAKPKFDINALKSAYQKAGIKPGVGSALNKLKKVAAPTMGAMMNMHRLADAAKAVKGVAKPLAGAGKALTNPNNMGRAAHLAQNVATGGHAWNPAAAAKRAISL